MDLCLLPSSFVSTSSTSVISSVTQCSSQTDHPGFWSVKANNDIIKKHFRCQLDRPKYKRPQEKKTSICCRNDIDVGNHRNASSMVMEKKSPDGIGILSFHKGKNYLITGGTGFLAKVFIEKLLRTIPDIGKIFLLIKAKDREEAVQRLKTEIINTELFSKLRQMHGVSYATFMMKKLIPVAGNICETNLGINGEVIHQITQEVDVIVNSAGNTTFDERYDVALSTNLNGPSHLLAFAKKCERICVLLHFSTAYVSGKQQGIIMEKPFHMDEIIGIGRNMFSANGDETLVPELLDTDHELKLVSNSKNLLIDIHLTEEMKALGLKRANNYGWPNTYSFTKAMGEMIIDRTREDIPVVIVRPTIIESTHVDPFPGWIQGNRMLDPLILSYAKGRLPGLIGDPEVIMDVVPVDMVVNATMAAIARHGTTDHEPQLNIYHVASSLINPVRLGDLFDYSCDFFTSSPLMASKGIEQCLTKMEFFSCRDDYSSYIKHVIAKENGPSDSTHLNGLQAKYRKKSEHIIQLAQLYEPYMLYKGWFDIENTQKLMEDMSEEEMRKFGFDMRSIDWKNYFVNIHIPGLLKHVLKRNTKSSVNEEGIRQKVTN